MQSFSWLRISLSRDTSLLSQLHGILLRTGKDSGNARRLVWSRPQGFIQRMLAERGKFPDRRQRIPSGTHIRHHPRIQSVRNHRYGGTDHVSESEYRYVRRRTVSALFFTLLLCWATVLAASAADTNAPQSGLKTGIDASATSGQAAGDVKATATTDPLAGPVSYGLRVLSAREEMVLSGLCGNEIHGYEGMTSAVH